MRFSRFSVAALMGAALLSAQIGCESKSKPVAGVESAKTAAPAKADDAEAISALEAAGAKLQKADNGSVTLVDLRDAGGGKQSHFAAAAKLPSLKTIVCTGADVTDEAIAELKNHPALERLDATSRSAIGDDGAEALSTIGTLVDLNLEKSEISDAAYTHLGKLTKLRRLRAPFTKTSDVGVIRLADSTQLELLDFRDCTGVSDEGINALEKLSKLRSFKVWGNQITDKSLPTLAKMTNLTALGLQDTHVGGEGDALTKLTKLQEFDVFRSHFNDGGLKAISGASGMKILKLRDCRVTAEGFKVLSKFTNLERLDLSESQANNSTLEAISGLTKLVELELWTTRVTDDGLVNIVKLPLKNLVLEDIYDVTNAGLAHVGKIKTLESLTLSKTGVTDDGLPELYGLENLRVLLLDNTVVSKKGVEALRAKLPKLETVRF